jgi:hypothetical protein
MTRCKPSSLSFYFPLRILVEHNMFICSNMWYQSYLYAVLFSIKFLLNPVIFVNIIYSRKIEKHTDIFYYLFFVKQTSQYFVLDVCL